VIPVPKTLWDCDTCGCFHATFEQAWRCAGSSDDGLGRTIRQAVENRDGCCGMERIGEMLVDASRAFTMRLWIIARRWVGHDELAEVFEALADMDAPGTPEWRRQVLSDAMESSNKAMRFAARLAAENWPEEDSQ
jgi:hypothetical protein